MQTSKQDFTRLIHGLSHIDVLKLNKDGKLVNAESQEEVTNKVDF